MTHPTEVKGETPRTDAWEKETGGGLEGIHQWSRHAHYGWKRCRLLERENQQLQEALTNAAIIMRGVGLERAADQLEEALSKVAP